jgi:4-amino-4-deoxy-L-arabinose transferase-like glycosyltransferase
MRNTESGRTDSLLSAPWMTPFFWVSACLLLFSWLGSRALSGSEDRWAEISREMILSGNILRPDINGEIYFDKPLLSYWFIVFFSKIFGGVSEFTSRLPSALAGLAALAAVISLGRKLWSEEAGRAAGWILLTSYGFVLWSRTASADVENMAAGIIAVWWYWRREEKPCFSTYFVFYLICSIGANTKGLIAFAVPVVAIFPDLVADGKWRKHFNISNFIAACLGVALYVLPFAAAETSVGKGVLSLMTDSVNSNGFYMVFRENIVRYFRPFDHAEPFYVYFYFLPLLFCPWIIFFVFAMWRITKSYWRISYPSRVFYWSVTLIFLFFTLSGSRRGYYILPILPFCALLTAAWLTRCADDIPEALTRAIRWAFRLAAALLIISPVIIMAAAVWYRHSFSFSLYASCVAGGVLCVAALLLTRAAAGKRARGPAEFFPPAAALFFAFFCLVCPELDRYRSEKSFADEMRKLNGGIPPERIAFYQKIPTAVLFYLSPPAPVVSIVDSDSLEEFLSRPGKALFAAQSKYIPDLAAVIPPAVLQKPSVEQKTYPWEKNPDKKLKAWLIDTPQNGSSNGN